MTCFQFGYDFWTGEEVEDLVTTWFDEIEKREREPGEWEVEIAHVKAIPFIHPLAEGVIRLHEADEAERELMRLVLAALPSGGFLDVGDPRLYQEYQQAGLKLAPALVIGRLTEDDCRRIGIDFGE